MRRIMALYLGLGLFFSAWSCQSAEIRWKVENRFPVLTSPSDFSALEAMWPASGTPLDFVSQPGFTSRFRDLGVHRRTAWKAKDGVYDRAILLRSSNAIRAQVNGTSSATCRWLFRQGEVHAARQAPCGDEVRFDVDVRAPFDLSVIDEVGGITSSNGQAIKKRLIVGIGDSFASGEGNPDAPATWKDRAAPIDWFVRPQPTTWLATSAQWWDEACHRSFLSWQTLSALHEAISTPDVVVQYASFACSGAEVYDGFLRAQVSPPGSHGPGQRAKARAAVRDGGPGYMPNEVGRGEADTDVVFATQWERMLGRSQLNAMTDLLCETKAAKGKPWKSREAVLGVTRLQTYFGEFTQNTCDQMLVPDRVLVTLGGNDVAFSGIVKHSITPPGVRQDAARFARQVGWDVVRNMIGTVEPGAAVRDGVSQLGLIYADLDTALSAAGVRRDSVVLLLYPDPTGSEKNRQKCDLRTQDGNAPMSMLTWQQLHNRSGPFKLNKYGVLFGIRPKEFGELRTAFVEPLRAAQSAAACQLGWRVIDANEGVRWQGEDYAYCATSPSCSSASCQNGDRVRHWPKEKGSNQASLPALERPGDFDPYDPQRTRGFRYGMDAILTGASLTADKERRLKDDWLSLSAHPTAAVHARIASVLAASGPASPACSATPAPAAPTRAQ